MSYLKRLIERATDTSLDLENNKIGNYRITPQHSSNVASYSIYKTGARPYYSSSTRYKGKESHLLTINISNPKVRIEWAGDYLTKKEREDILSILREIYKGWRIYVLVGNDNEYEENKCRLCGRPFNRQ